MKKLTNSDYITFVLIFALGVFAGYKSKRCASITGTTVKIDTVTNYVPISGGIGSPLTVITYPKNRPVKTIYLRDTVTKQIEAQYDGFASVDTLRWDSLYVAVIDTGNCNGITSRRSTFGGKIPERSITKTIDRVFEKPAPLFQLNAGVTTSYAGKWRAVDLGPALTLDIGRKYLLGYSYSLNSSTHCITLQTKIK